MTVIRVSHQKNYVVINKSVLEDKNLSFKAKGIWTYCMSRPENWEFHVSHLITVSQDGEKSVCAGLKELEINGYLRKVQHRNKGKFTKFDYEVSEIKIILPQPEKRVAENAVAVKDGLLSNDLNQVMKEKVVCYPPPGAADSEQPLTKDEVKKMSVAEAKRGMRLPSELFKKTPEGTTVSIRLEEIFKTAVCEKKDWKTSEIHDAWEVLSGLSGPVRDLFAFIGGTIKNFRTAQRSEYLKKKGKECTPILNEKLKEDKAKSLASDTREHPSLGELMEKAGMKF